VLAGEGRLIHDADDVVRTHIEQRTQLEDCTGGALDLVNRLAGPRRGADIHAMVDQRTAPERAALRRDAQLGGIEADELDVAPIGDDRLELVALGVLAPVGERGGRAPEACAERLHRLVELVAGERIFAPGLDHIDDAAGGIEIVAEGPGEGARVGGLIGGARRAPDKAAGRVGAAGAPRARVEQVDALDRERLAHGADARIAERIGLGHSEIRSRDGQQGARGKSCLRKRSHLPLGARPVAGKSPIASKSFLGRISSSTHQPFIEIFWRPKFYLTGPLRRLRKPACGGESRSILR